MKRKLQWRGPAKSVRREEWFLTGYSGYYGEKHVPVTMITIQGRYKRALAHRIGNFLKKEAAK